MIGRREALLPIIGVNTTAGRIETPIRRALALALAPPSRLSATGRIPASPNWYCFATLIRRPRTKESWNWRVDLDRINKINRIGGGEKGEGERWKVRNSDG